MKRYDVLVTEKYETQSGEQKTAWTNVGSAWLRDNGSIGIKLRANIAVSCELVLMEPRNGDGRERRDPSEWPEELRVQEFPRKVVR